MTLLSSQDGDIDLCLAPSSGSADTTPTGQRLPAPIVGMTKAMTTTLTRIASQQLRYAGLPFMCCCAARSRRLVDKAPRVRDLTPLVERGARAVTTALL